MSLCICVTVTLCFDHAYFLFASPMEALTVPQSPTPRTVPARAMKKMLEKKNGAAQKEEEKSACQGSPSSSYGRSCSPDSHDNQGDP